MHACRGRFLRAVLLATLSTAAVAATGGVAHATPPVADFTMSATVVKVGDPVRFTDASSDPDGGAIVRREWDINADGRITDPNGSRQVSRAFDKAGTYPIFLRVTDAQGERSEVTKNLTVTTGAVPAATPPAPAPGPAPAPAAPPAAPAASAANKSPDASFSFSPQSPAVGQSVAFVSRSGDADGSIASQAWDLDGDGAFDDAGGGRAQMAFTTAGTHVVTLRVTDNAGASSTAFQTVTVRRSASATSTRVPAPTLFVTPFPIVRIRGEVDRSTVRITLLSVAAPSGSRATVRCRGRSCPSPRAVTKLARRGSVLRFRSVERRLRVGTILEVMVTRPRRIGKYTRFTIRRGAAPARTDGCMRYGAARPIRCPSR